MGKVIPLFPRSWIKPGHETRVQLTRLQFLARTTAEDCTCDPCACLTSAQCQVACATDRLCDACHALFPEESKP